MKNIKKYNLFSCSLFINSLGIFLIFNLCLLNLEFILFNVCHQKSLERQTYNFELLLSQHQIKKAFSPFACQFPSQASHSLFDVVLPFLTFLFPRHLSFFVSRIPALPDNLFNKIALKLNQVFFVQFNKFSFYHFLYLMQFSLKTFLTWPIFFQYHLGYFQAYFFQTMSNVSDTY